MKPLILITALLTGCAGAPTRVEVPIAVPCVDKLPEKPEVCAPNDNTRRVLVNCERNKGYAMQLEAVLAWCKGSN